MEARAFPLITSNTHDAGQFLKREFRKVRGRHGANSSPLQSVATANDCYYGWGYLTAAGFFPSTSVHTGGASSKALTRIDRIDDIDVMQKQLLQLCRFYSVHRVAAHDAACRYGIAYVACCV